MQEIKTLTSDYYCEYYCQIINSNLNRFLDTLIKFC